MDHKKIIIYNGHKKYFHIIFEIFIFLLIFVKPIASEFITFTATNITELENAFINAQGNDAIIIIDGKIENMKRGFEIKLNSNPIKNLIIRGKNRKESVLGFSSAKYGLNIYNMTSFEIENITFKGRLNLRGLNITYVHDMDYYGLFDTTSPTVDGYVHINNCEFYPDLKQTRDETVKFNAGGRTVIENSVFTANLGCKDSLIKYNGRNCEVIDFTVRNSIFNCEHLVRAVIVQTGNVSIESSSFFNGYNNKQGALVYVRNSNSLIRNCTFRNGYSITSGGALYSLDNPYYEAVDLKVYNTSSNGGGGLLFEDTNDYNKITVLKNITYINLWKDQPINGIGSIISLVDKSEAYISNLYGEGFFCDMASSCNMFIVNKSSKLEMENVEVKNVFSKESGLIFRLNAAENVVPNVTAKNCTFSNLNQQSSSDASVIWNNGGVLNLYNVTFNDVNLESSSLIYSYNNGTINYMKGKFNNVNNKIFNKGLYTETGGYLNITDVSFNNIFFNGEFIRTEESDLLFDKINIENYNTCNDSDKKCLKTLDNMMNDPESVFLRVDTSNTITITNSKIKNSNFYTLFIYGNESYIKINNMNIENCNFTKGSISYTNEKPFRIGNIDIDNSNFNRVYSINGPIVNIGNLPDLENEGKIVFNNVIIRNTEAEYFGGVIYSNNKDSHSPISFNNCTFNNTKAKIGSICHSYKIESEPFISNKNEIIETLGKTAFTTNPVKLKFDNEINDSYSLMSGDRMKDTIQFIILDDYNNTVKTELDGNSIDNYIFFYIRTDDSINSLLIGQMSGHCINNICSLPNPKILGNPGTYHLYIKLVTYGKYEEFNNNYKTIEINIKECEKPYLNYNRDNSKIKSCYIPKCDNSCNGGTCINENLCDCTGTNRLGMLCDQYYSLKRILVLDIGVIVFSSALIIATLISFLLLMKNRKNNIIKAGSVDFLIIILLGILLYSIYSLCLGFERTRTTCIITVLFNNIGFIFIYGSILIKTYRIYKIFKMRKKDRILKKEYMFSFLSSLAILHLAIFALLVKLDYIEPVKKIDVTEKEYIGCKMPFKEFLTDLINLSILFISVILSYFIRDVKEEFKEPLAVPVYLYLIFEILQLLIKSDSYTPILAIDYIFSYGSIITSSAVLYYVYIKKFIAVYENNRISSIEEKDNSNNNTHPKPYSNFGNLGLVLSSNPQSSHSSIYSSNIGSRTSLDGIVRRFNSISDAN